MSASRFCLHAWLSAGLIWLPEASDTGRQIELGDSQSDEPQCLPTINIFELWENGSQQARAVSRNFHYPMCFAVICPWNYQPKAISLREVVEEVANNSGRFAHQSDGVANNSLSAGTHFPNQPSLSTDPLSATP